MRIARWHVEGDAFERALAVVVEAPGGRTRRQGVLARLRPVLPVRHPDHPRHRPRSPLHPRRASDERDREARPRAVRRHGRLHRPCLRRVLDPRLRVRPAHPGPALEAPLRVRARGRPEAPAPAGRRQGEREPDRPELGGHPARGGHHGGRDHAAQPAPAQARRVSAPERAGGGAAGKSAASSAPCS